MAATVIDALRRFLPAHVREHAHHMGEARRRAVWAITHCRTPEMGGHLHACGACGRREFRFHSCHHRSCPQCGGQDTAAWVETQLDRRVGAPYFMVTFTLPAELRPLFFTAAAGEMYRLIFAAASGALRDLLANPRWLGASASGFTMVLHTWNQRLHFHPHIHAIVPGAGIDAAGRVVAVKNPGFLVPQAALRRVFRARLRDALAALDEHPSREDKSFTHPAIDPDVWTRDWGVDLRPFGSGTNIIKYLGRYVCRTAIGDSRIISITDTHVSFRYKDRGDGGVEKIETIPGGEFVARYLRHVLPRGLRAVRHYGYCHPAGRVRRERVAFHTGRPLLIGAAAAPPVRPPHTVACPCCGTAMTRVLRLPPPWTRQAARPAASRAPPAAPSSAW